MELIFIVGIIIAIIGALTIAAVVWQGDSRASAASPIETAAPPTAEAAPAPSPLDDAIAASVAAAFSPQPVTVEEDAPLTIESITALYAHANDEVAVTDDAVQIKVANALANQIEQLYADYVRLGEERSRLAEALFANLLFEKIERSAGRLEIATERQTLDLREQFSRVSGDYSRVQFRLGSLQHLNTRLGDPRVAQQLEEIVLEIRQLANKASTVA
jgi:type I site-specific restriction endonuclease